MRARVRGLTNTAVLTSAAFVLFTTSLIVGLEAYCRYRDRHPTSQDFATLMDYPADPERYFKIAIFGESAAGGANSISKFEDVIRGEITRRNAAGRPVYVHNYAARGVMFHNQQAETVKANIGRYDAVLIYAGLSEFIAYSEDRTFLGIPIRAAGRKAAFVVEDANPVEQYLNSQSHLYGWFKRFQQRHPQWSAVVVSDGAIGKGDVPPPRPVSMQQIFEKTANDYKRDLDAIAGLARRHQTHVFVSSVIVNEAWKPLASMHGPGIDAASRRLFDDNVDAGAEVYERGGFDAALPYFRTAYRVDPDSAIANYYLGMTYVRLRQHDEGRKYLARAIELDAKPYYRPSALLWKAAAAVERESGGEYYHYVDAVSAYHDALAHGFMDADFIADLQHPNVTGHMFLARQFLCAMRRAGLGPAARGVDDCVPVWEFDFRRAVAEYQERVDGIAMMKYYIPHAVSRWFIGKADVSTYPNDFLVAAEREIEEFYAQSERKPEDRVLYLVFKAYIELKRKPLSSSGKTRAIELLNQAQAVDASFLHGHSWASEFDNIGSLGDVLARNGIAFQPDRGIFADAST